MSRTLVVVAALGLLGLTVLWFMIGTSAGAIGRAEVRALALGGGDGETVLVTIQPGEDAASIGRKLEEAGVIQDGRLFQIMAGLMGAEGQLAAGDYEFPKNMAAIQAVQRIRRGQTATVTFTVPEGWRLEQIADHLQEQGIVSREAFLAAAASRSYTYPFLSQIPQGASLEGFLFPDTYTFPKGVTAEQIVDRMLANFQEKVLSQVGPLPAGGRLQLSLYDVVTLASIVEREAAVAEERPTIASVFLNRLNLGMALEADPTVQYALTVVDPTSVQRYGYWKRELTIEDLRVNSPYNTRRFAGLTPGPIANPGLDSILAVVRPQQTDYLYFVCSGGGRHVFATTAAEHQANVARYQDNCGGEG
ncbi:MAG TPA: endolytic transglycosylase MltG [Dehalococcoidia bacterium]